MSRAVILAAGLSSRMGRFKPLLPFGGKTVLETAIDRLWEGGVEEVVVVTGLWAENVEQILAGKPVRVLYNSNFAHTQMFDSVRLALENLPAGDTFLLPADLPQFSPELLVRLEEMEGEAVYPVCDGRNGHPLLLRKQTIAKVLRHNGEKGLKGALEQLRTARLLTEDRGCLLDMDTLGDYQRLLAFRAASVPTKGERLALFERFRTPAHIRAHCAAVRSVVLRLSEGMASMNRELLAAAAEIHDAARTEPQHAQVLAEALVAMGYDRLAGIVAVHMDLPQEMSDTVTEASLLYLADKMVDGAREISLRERFEQAERRFADDPVALSAIKRRQAIAKRILLQIEARRQSA